MPGALSYDLGMAPVWEKAAELLGRLMVGDPMVYLGLLIVIDPPRINRVLDGFADALCRICNLVRGLLWQPPVAVSVFPPRVNVIRLTGLILTVLGLLLIVAPVN
jgi:hypothetical protein